MRKPLLAAIFFSFVAFSGCTDIGPRITGWRDWLEQPYFHVNGRITLRDENSKAVSVRQWLRGRRHGQWKDFYSNGNPKDETNWMQGHKEGPARTWHENGTLKTEGAFKNGKPEGAWKEWFENGVLGSEIIFENGVAVGVAKTWDNEGRLIMESSSGGKNP
jgi:antitoxin component YwqK of YwqJK toxin-antitoxin module